jgi:excisionase family DNA binding protein
MKEFFEGKNKIRLYSISEVCEMMGTTRPFISKIIESGELNVTVISGRRYVPEPALLTYLQGKPYKEKRGRKKSSAPTDGEEGTDAGK